MFGHITGKVLDLKFTKAVVNVYGMGFVVNSTPFCIEKLRVGAEASFWLHTAVRENSIDLYGFETEEELRLFELLLGVSGIGPKSALSIIGVAGPKAIEEAVGTGDTSLLTKTSGIGRKTAEKIILELNGKIRTVQKGAAGAKENKENIDVYDALESLGYREKEIREVLRNLPKGLAGANEKIKHALKNLGK